jgi:ABC-2 type transport system ATP-binding protein
VVEELRARGTTVVFTTHAMDEAEALADRLAIIDRGRLVALGSPVELTADSGATETRFTAAPGLDTGALAVALGLAPDAVLEARPGDYVVRAPAGADLVADLTGWLRDRGVVIGDLHATRRSLEEVFLRLTSSPASHKGGG